MVGNRVTNHLVDGHLRVKLAIRRHEPNAPVKYAELRDEDGRLVSIREARRPPT
jgi:hypothetical protein